MAPPNAGLDTIRAEVRSLLEGSPAFQALEPEKRRGIAQSLVQVAGYLAEPGWMDASPPKDPVAASALADAVDDVKKRLAKAPGAVGDNFKAGALREGTEAFGQLVNKVDFPAFVGGLVQGVFQAVVNASIQQMEAYGELLAAAAKSTEQFANDHVSDAQARDWVANKHPGLVAVDTSGERAVLRPREDAPGDQNLGRLLNLGRDADPGDSDDELAIVAGAKMEMARQRQQLMATMVLLGINRIVVTNGQIHAKVLFDVQTSDEAKRKARAEMHDENANSLATSANVGGVVGGWLGGGASSSASHNHKTTVQSAIDDTSESKAQAKAQLSGEVKLTFKSETFPLEKMVDVMGMQTLNNRATPLPMAPGGQAAQPAPAPARAPPGGAR